MHTSPSRILGSLCRGRFGLGRCTYIYVLAIIIKHRQDDRESDQFHLPSSHSRVPIYPSLDKVLLYSTSGTANQSGTVFSSAKFQF